LHSTVLNYIFYDRDDGKDSLKFYTDPGYFFELWSVEITKDAENQAKRHKHRKGRAVVRMMSRFCFPSKCDY